MQYLISLDNSIIKIFLLGELNKIRFLLDTAEQWKERSEDEIKNASQRIDYLKDLDARIEDTLNENGKSGQ